MPEFKYREKGFCQPSNNDADRIVHEAGYAAYGLYVYMLSIRNSVTRECFPSEQFLSEAAGQRTKKQVIALLGKLKEIDAIWCDEKEPTGQGKSRHYKFPSIPEDMEDIKKILAKRMEDEAFRRRERERKPVGPAPVDMGKKRPVREVDDGEPDFDSLPF